MVELNLDANDCHNAAELLELYFFQNIRDDEYIDSLEYVKSILRCIDELNRVGAANVKVRS